MASTDFLIVEKLALSLTAENDSRNDLVSDQHDECQNIRVESGEDEHDDGATPYNETFI